MKAPNATEMAESKNTAHPLSDDKVAQLTCYPGSNGRLRLTIHGGDPDRRVLYLWDDEIAELQNFLNYQEEN